MCCLAQKGMIEVQSVHGTRDFYPDDMRIQNWLFDQFKSVAHSFAFQVCLVLSCLFLLFKKKLPNPLFLI